jgi:hypothetical protein
VIQVLSIQSQDGIDRQCRKMFLFVRQQFGREGGASNFQQIAAKGCWVIMVVHG